MNLKIILASKSKVRKNILEKNNIECLVEPANIDEDFIKNSLENIKEFFCRWTHIPDCYFQLNDNNIFISI